MSWSSSNRERSSINEYPKSEIGEGYVQSALICVWLRKLNSSEALGWHNATVTSAMANRRQKIREYWILIMPGAKQSPLRKLDADTLGQVATVKIKVYEDVARSLGDGGLEKTGFLAKTDCLTNLGLFAKKSKYGAPAGIEPTSHRPKRRILPLYYKAIENRVEKSLAFDVRVTKVAKNATNFQIYCAPFCFRKFRR